MIRETEIPRQLRQTHAAALDLRLDPVPIPEHALSRHHRLRRTVRRPRRASDNT